MHSLWFALSQSADTSSFYAVPVSGFSLDMCRRWLSTTRYLRGKGQECDAHRRSRTLRRALAAWRSYTKLSLHKASSGRRSDGGQGWRVCGQRHLPAVLLYMLVCYVIRYG